MQPLIQRSTARKLWMRVEQCVPPCHIILKSGRFEALPVALGFELQIQYDTSSFSCSRCSHQASRPALGPSSSSTQVTSSSTSASTRTARARSCHRPGFVYPACTCGLWRHRPEPLSPKGCALFAPYPAFFLPPRSHPVCCLLCFWPIMLSDLTPSTSLGGPALWPVL